MLASVPISVVLYLLILFAIVGVVGWRLWRAAQAIELQLREELACLEKSSQKIQNDLSAELQQTTAAFQAISLEKAALETEGIALKQQCARLRAELGQTVQQAQQDAQATAFEKIQTLLSQYPTLRKMTEAKPDLPARNIVATLTALDSLVQCWGYLPIGVPWEREAYNPQIHQGDVADLQAGETVYVRFVGYRDVKRDRILLPAKVSRTLPQGMLS
jgi:molecular chaperone GrpE (heat shock protein)